MPNNFFPENQSQYLYKNIKQPERGMVKNWMHGHGGTIADCLHNALHLTEDRHISISSEKLVLLIGDWTLTLTLYQCTENRWLRHNLFCFTRSQASVMITKMNHGEGNSERVFIPEQTVVLNTRGQLNVHVDNICDYMHEVWICWNQGVKQEGGQKISEVAEEMFASGRGRFCYPHPQLRDPWELASVPLDVDPCTSGITKSSSSKMR